MDLRTIKKEIEFLKPNHYRIIPCPENPVSRIFTMAEFKEEQKKYIKAIPSGQEIYAVLFGHYKKNNSGRLVVAESSEYFVNDGTVKIEEEEEEEPISYPQEITKVEPIKEALPQVKEPEKVEEKLIQREPSDAEIEAVNQRIWREFY